MMNKKDKEKYIERYKINFRKYGYSPKSLGWGEYGKQKIRFKALSEIGIKMNSSILDVGCGFGDFYEYLCNLGWNAKYLGVDIFDEFLAEAKKQHPKTNFENIDIIKSNISLKFDYVIASGIFNAKLEYEDNYTYIKKMITKMFQIANQGVAVDFLSSYVDYENEIAFHSSPEEIFQIAKSISRRVSLRHDYLPYEFIIYIYKQDLICNPSSTFTSS